MPKSSLNDPQQEWIAKFVTASNNTLIPTTYLRAMWFRNPVNHNSLRLTHQGFQWINKHSTVQSYDVVLNCDVFSKQLIQLERVFHSPYYLTPTKIKVFSEEDAIMLQLHAGDLAQYLNNLQQ